MAFRVVESADKIVAHADDRVGIGRADEIGIVVVPLKRLLTPEAFAKQEGEVALSVEIEIRWECCSSDFADRGKPVNGTGGGADNGF